MGIIAEIQNDLEAGSVKLITEYRARLFSEAVRLCKDSNWAEDLVMMTFDKAIRNIDSYKRDDNFFGWLKTILTNLYKDELRSPVRSKTIPMDSSDIESLAGADNATVNQIVKDSDHDALREAIERLDPEYKKALVMHYFGELPVKNIALALKLPLGTVLWRMDVARKMLANDLGKRMGRKPVAVLAALLLGISTLFGGWKAAEALGWLPAEEAPRAEEAQLAAEEEATAEEEVAEDTISSDSNLTQEKGTTTMNLKAVKSVAAAAATALTLSASAEPVTPAIPASAYIQDGLIAQWDAIDNAGVGQHENTLTEWVNLKDAAAPMTLSGDYAWSDSSIEFNKTATTGLGTFVVPATPDALGRTIEAAVVPKDGHTSGRFFADNCLPSLYLNNSCFSIYAAGGLDGAICDRTVFDPINHFTTYGVSVNIPTKETKTYFDGAYYLDKTTTCTPTYKTALTAYLANIASKARAMSGTFYALRIYNRVLTDTEIALNTAIDKVRFNGEDPATVEWPDGIRWNSAKGALEYRVTATSTAANPVSINNGIFLAETNAWCELGAPVTVKCQAADHYRVARWDGAPADAVVGVNQITFAANSLTISPVLAYDLSASAYVQRNLVEQWDGIENVGRGLPHDSSLNQWNGLVGGKVLAFSTYGNMNFTENSLQSLSGSYYIADCKTITTNDFNVFDGFIYESTECAASYYEPLFGSHTRVIWLRSDSLGLSRKKAYSVSRANPAGNMNVYAAYVPGTDIPSSVYINGEHLTTEVSPNPNNLSAYNYLSIGINTANRLRGGWYALRLYKKELSEAEQAMNRLVDKIRFEYADPATLTWPTGVRVQNGVLEVCLTVTFDGAKGSVTLNGESVTSGDEIWIEKDSSVTLVATPKAGYKLKTWSGYYFDELPTFERQALEFKFSASLPADLGAQFVDESVGIWNVPGHFDTLTEALASDQVVDGDTIHLLGGVHSSGDARTDMTIDSCTLKVFARVDKALLIEGVGSDQTVIDCNGNGTLLIDHSDAILRNLSISNFLQATTAAAASVPALFVNHGLATNICVDGRQPFEKTKGLSKYAVVVDNGGVLCGSRIRDIYATGSYAVYVRNATMCHTCIEDCTLGYIMSQGGSQSVVENCEFNRIKGLTNFNKYDNNTPGAIRHSRFAENEYSGNGLQFTATLSVESCAIVSNQASSTYSQFSLIAPSGESTLKNCLIADNEVKAMPIISVGNSKFRMFNCTIVNNKAALDNRASVVFTTNNSRFGATNTIFACNTLSDGETERTIFVADGITGTAYSFGNSRYPDAEAEDPNGNISDDPLFEDAAAANYMLGKGSPCVDTGDDNALLPTDIDGRVRPQDGTGDGIAITDMGCYEKPEPTEALEVAVNVEMEGVCEPATAKLTAIVTGKRATNLTFEWYAIRTFNGEVTIITNAPTSEATTTFAGLLSGSWNFSCTVKNDATPPNVASDVTKYPTMVLPKIAYVALGGSNEWPYDSEAKAAHELSDAIEAAGEKVIIKAGTYKDFTHTIDEASGKECTVALNRGITVEGEKGAVIDCGGLGGLVVGHKDAIFKGVTLTNFVTNVDAGPIFYVGAGQVEDIIVQGAGTQIVRQNENCYFEEGTIGTGIQFLNITNSPTASGSAWFMQLHGATLRKLRFERCYMWGVTRFIYTPLSARQWRSKVEDCTFSQCVSGNGAFIYAIHADAKGVKFEGNKIGGVNLANAVGCVVLSGASLVDSIFTDTTSASVIYCETPGIAGENNSITNCLFAFNRIGRATIVEGDGNSKGDTEIVNCTISCNHSQPTSKDVNDHSSSGGIGWKDAASAHKTTVINSIVYGNTMTNGLGEVVLADIPTSLFLGEDHAVEFRNSCFPEANDWVAGDLVTLVKNIATDPLFRKPAMGDFTLRSVSPCVDTGDNLNWNKKTDKDLLGQPRIQHKIIDMGCYETIPLKGTVLFIR